MAADENIDKTQNLIIEQLKQEIASLETAQIEFSERRRGYVRAGIIGWICLLISYIVVRYTGIQEGMIKPDVIWSFFTGVFITKMVDHYYNAMTKQDRIL